jgi:hypothetical protein
MQRTQTYQGCKLRISGLIHTMFGNVFSWNGEDLHRSDDVLT